MFEGLSNTAKSKRVRALLIERFPGCFKEKLREMVPLQVGIRREIQKRIPELTNDELSLGLFYYTRGLKTYRARFLRGATRFGLNGEVTGEVSAKEAMMAGEQLMAAGLPELAAPIARSLGIAA